MNQLCEPWSGRNALQRTLTIVALAWMLTLGRGTALAAPTQAEVRGADPVAQALLDSRHKPTPTDKLAKRLAQPGAVALPSLFATLARGRFAVSVGERGNSSRPVNADEHEALVAAIGELSWSQVRDFLEEVRNAKPVEAVRLTALELIGAHGTRHDLSSLLKWCELAETERRVSRTMRAGFEASLGNLLERGVPSSFELSQLYRAAHLSLVPSILECVGQRPSEDHLLMLSDCLGSVPEADSLVLAEIGQQAKFLHHPIEVISRERVRSYLQNKSAGLLVGGILAAEQMEDTGAIRELTRLLTHEDRNVKERALIALKSISTEQLGRDPEAWNEWHASAQAWWNERAPTLMREVEDPSASIASRAVLELSKHRFFRHQLAEPVARGLNHSESEVVILTCATLGHLGSPQSVPLLLERLTDHKLEIRRAALQALRRLTGADYGEEPEGWRKAGW